MSQDFEILKDPRCPLHSFLWIVSKLFSYKNDADLIVNNTKNDNEAAKLTLDYIRTEFQALNNNI